MSRRRIVVALMGAAMLAGGAAPALGESVDQRSTHRFIVATVVSLRAAIAAHAKVARALNGFVARVATGCPGSLPATLGAGTAAQQSTGAALSKEADAELALAEFAALRPSLGLYGQRLARLKWRSPGLRRAVGATVRNGEAALALVPPDICADIAAAASSAFATIPSDTYAFLRAADAALRSGPSATELLRRMKPYVVAGEAGPIRHLRHLEARLGVVLLKPGVGAFTRLGAALAGSTSASTLSSNG